MLIDMPQLLHLRIAASSYEVIDFDEWENYDFVQSPLLQTLDLSDTTDFEPVLEWLTGTLTLRSLRKLKVTINDIADFRELVGFLASGSVLTELDVAFGLLETIGD
jgi:hypothetical protein